MSAPVVIAQVSEYYYPHLGGITEHVHHVARYLAERGHEVRIVTSHVDGAPPRPDVERIGERVTVWRVGDGVSLFANGSLARVTVGGRRLTAAVARALAGAELVHVHSPLFPVLPYLAVKAARARGTPTVGTFHTSFPHLDRSLVLRGLGKVASRYLDVLDGVIAVSPSAARSIAATGARVDCALVPNGVDLATWSGAEPEPRLADGKRHIAFLGRLDPRNQLETLLDAFVRLRARRDDVGLVVVGDGPRKEIYRARVPEALRGDVRFVGAVERAADRARWLAGADAIAFTAGIVSHPMALLEAMASGRPLVAFGIEGVRELVAPPGEPPAGLLCPPGDAAALAQALAWLLDGGGDARALAAVALERARRFDWAAIGPRIEEVYAQARARVLARAASPPSPRARSLADATGSAIANPSAQRRSPAEEARP